MKTFITAIAAILALTSLHNSVIARESLYKLDRSPLAPVIAHKPGDLLTIIVSETASTFQGGDNKRETSSEHSFDLGKFFLPGFKMNQGFDDTMTSGDTPGLDFEFENDIEGKASNKSSHLITTKLQAQIIEAPLPGQLIIQGQRTLHINGKRKTFLITGTIRQEDITADNTVDSQYMANAYIEIDGEIAGKDLKPSLISEIITTIF